MIWALGALAAAASLLIVAAAAVLIWLLGPWDEERSE